MKQEFSTHWISSTQPRKQRKYRYNAPLHVKGTFLHAHLSKELRAKHNTRSIRLRTGDEVKVLRGQFAGKSGKVERVDVYFTRVFVSGMESLKRDGTKKPYPLQPSKLLITKLADDKRRLPVAQKTRTAQTPNIPKKNEKTASSDKQARTSKSTKTTDKQVTPAQKAKK
jgi:large subunit ribosomal protein L24